MTIELPEIVEKLFRSLDTWVHMDDLRSSVSILYDQHHQAWDDEKIKRIINKHCLDVKGAKEPILLERCKHDPDDAKSWYYRTLPSELIANPEDRIPYWHSEIPPVNPNTARKKAALKKRQSAA